MSKYAFLALALAISVTPAAAIAQVTQCTPPRLVPRPRPDLPSASQPRRILPIGSYTLAITWTPQYCAGKSGASDAFQCANAAARFGFTLHGLWPDGEGKDWPQYCRATGILPRQTIRQNICVTPSAQLIQHEWAKHGTCMRQNGQVNGPPIRPDAYFGRSRALYQALRFPDMAALARRDTLTAGQLARAVASANPGITADMIRVTTSRDGWLDELWLCLDTRFRYARCGVHGGGVNEGAGVRVRAG